MSVQRVIQGIVYGTHLTNTKNHIIDGFRQVGAEDGFRDLVGYIENMPLSDIS